MKICLLFQTFSDRLMAVTKKHHVWNSVFSLVNDTYTRWKWSASKHVYLSACCIVCTAMPILCAKCWGQYLIQIMCNYDLNKSQININEIFIAHLFHLHSTAVLAQRQRRVVNKPVKLSLIQADMWKPLALILAGSALCSNYGLCLGLCLPAITSLNLSGKPPPPGPPAGRENVPEQRLKAAEETTSSTSG